MVATLSGLLITVLAAVATVASPAFANGDGCCQVSVENIPAQFPAGGQPEPFTLRVVNQTQGSVRYLEVLFALQASGLVGDLVHLQRERDLGEWHNVGTFTQRGVHSGAVMAKDQIDFGTPALPPGGEVSIEYQLAFNKKMPGAGLTLSVQVQPRRSYFAVSSAGPYQSMILAVGQPIAIQPDPNASPSASDTPTAADSAAAVTPADQSSLSGGDTSGDGGSLMWLAYTIGALLLLGGVGVIGTLLSRRGPQATESDWDEQRQYRNPAPTQQFPVMPDPIADPPDQTWIDPASGR